MSSTTSRITVVGAGSVGSYFGAVLARAGHPVTLVARPDHVAAIEARGLKVHKADGDFTVRLPATISLDAVRGADLVLLCVKSRDTEDLARRIAPLLEPGAVVMSLQNGVENPAAIARHVRQPVVPTAVYVATAMPAPGEVRHFGRGELVIGPANPHDAADAALRERLRGIAALFGGAGVPVQVSDAVMDELWAKLLVNCAYNAISALTQQPYGAMAAQAPIRELQENLVREVLAVARASGRALDEQAARASVEQIARSMPGQLSSTAQDLARGKATEIDDLNGLIVRRGAELGIATPANQSVYALVKLAEAARINAKPA
ncbi:MAG: 2-dehydropantoate 2-reductase [Betaproteobacteria bacterium]|nr:2-dehydropantoate 2-reductase [Betaproteobacteria bacterium]MBU6513748.1 2-dehydropantoate 2-reductase [Betaproteobacteria bacterium]MDE1954741.1 2-dehydropantoate 2-reductase [Betaproteobacteria bacterium]MDE2152055.1 2-dehydropantoate 2-reductase [Betaproteobacteria bacterium]